VEAGNADDPENGNSYYLPGIAALGGSTVKLENPDSSGDDVSEPPEDSEDEEDSKDEADSEDEEDKTLRPEVGSPPLADVTNKSGRKRAYFGESMSTLPLPLLLTPFFCTVCTASRTLSSLSLSFLSFFPSLCLDSSR